MPERIETVLFDFSGTLGDEIAFGPSSDMPPNWVDVYTARFAQPGFNDRWQRGELTTTALIEDFARQLGTEIDIVHAYIVRLCRTVTLRPGITAAVAARKRRAQPQALVTVNPDAFHEIAEHLALTELFEVIVLSCQEGTTDKIQLCRIALQRLGRPTDFNRVLLIDDRAEHVHAFEDAGGSGYRFVDDATFLADLKSGILPPSLAP